MSQEKREQTDSATSSEGRSEFVWNIHSYVNEYIRFADAKAAVLLTWCSSLIGFLVAGDRHRLWTSPHFALRGIDWSVTFWAFVALLTFVLLGCGFIAGVLSLRPRWWSSRSGGKEDLIFWQNVSSHDSAEAYVNRISAVPTEEFARRVAHHVYDLSRVCAAKYRWIGRGIIFAIGGTVLAASVVIFH